MDFSGAQVPASVTRAPAVMVALLGEAGAGVAGGSRATAMLRLREILDDARTTRSTRSAYNTEQRRDYVARPSRSRGAAAGPERADSARRSRRTAPATCCRAMRLADEFKVRLVLIGASEGWMVADQLAKARVPVVVKPLTSIPTLRFARRDTGERGAPVEGRRGRRARLVRHAELAPPAAGSGERDRQRHGSRRRAARPSRSRRRGSGASPTASVRSRSGRTRTSSSGRAIRSS